MSIYQLYTLHKNSIKNRFRWFQGRTGSPCLLLGWGKRGGAVEAGHCPLVGRGREEWQWRGRQHWTRCTRGWGWWRGGAVEASHCPLIGRVKLLDIVGKSRNLIPSCFEAKFWKIHYNCLWNHELDKVGLLSLLHVWILYYIMTWWFSSQNISQSLENIYQTGIFSAATYLRFETFWEIWKHTVEKSQAKLWKNLCKQVLSLPLHICILFEKVVF